jgi:hypothetical protein
VGKIYRSRLGHRVDPPLQFDEKALGAMKAKKLCNKYFLTGSCRYTDCPHDHSPKLTTIELQTLRYIARLSPCSNLYCENESCTAGHRCVQDPKCNHGKVCRWPPEMHNVDTRIVNQITMT